jgi:alcohol dehydrogenase class IV
MFDFRMPASVRFGNGVLADIGAQAAALGLRKALLVCDPGIVKLGLVDRALGALTSAGVDAAVFDAVIPEPPDTNVAAGLAAFREAGCDGLIGLGGGSSIDVAKAVGAMARNPGVIADYAVGGKPLAQRKAPVLAAPTTAGTGSEVTRNTIITDTQRDVKLLIAHPYLIPEAALVDPALTMTMPPDLTMATGIDALTHALEAYISVKATAMSDIFALEAIELIAGNLRQAWANGGNVAAREKMMLGSLMAGMAFGNASVALVHGMARPIGANFHVPHGLSNAVLLAECMQFTMIGAPERFADIADAMGENTDGLSVMDAAQLAVDALARLCDDVGVPPLCECHVDAEKFKALAPKMAGDAIASGSPGNNPRKATAEEIVGLYLRCL